MTLQSLFARKLAPTADGDEGAAAPAAENTPAADGNDAADASVKAEATPEDAAAAAEPEKPADKGDKEPRIPKSRFDELNRRAKDREARLLTQVKELEEQIQTARQTANVSELQKKLSEAEEALDDAVIEGEKEKAKRARAEVRRLNDAIIDAKASEKAAEFAERRVGELRYEQALAQLEAEHPAINPDHEDFDEELMAEVADLMSAYLAAAARDGVRMNTAQALNKAAKVLLKKPQLRPEAPAIKQARAEEARRKAVDTVSKTPADTTKSGVDSDKTDTTDALDVTRMRVADLDKLTPEQIRKLRGDFAA